jgi:geranylgeranyl diphosphate synthase type I
MMQAALPLRGARTNSQVGPCTDLGGMLEPFASLLDESQLRVVEKGLHTLSKLSDDELCRAIRRPNALDLPCLRTAQVTLCAYRERVIDQAHVFLDRLTPPLNIRKIYDRSLDETRALAAMAPCLPALDFCAAVHVAEGGTLAGSLPLSVAGLFYYMGISLFDDVIDKDLNEGWEEHSDAQISFASIAMFSGLPTLALTQLVGEGVSHATRARMALWLQEASYEMATGQYLDVRIGASDATLDDCEQINQGKTGSTGALSARLGAALAGASDDRVDGYARACRDLYVAMQIASDIHDVWCKPVSPDLMNGIMTLPIVYALHALPAAERAELELRLRANDRTRDGHVRMRQLVTQSGALRYSLMQAELHRALAMSGFDELCAREEGKTLLSYLTCAARLGSWSS